MVWPSTGDIVRFGVALEGAQCGILGDGSVAAIGRDLGARFELVNREPRHMDDFQIAKGLPVAVVLTNAPQEIAAIYADGRLVIAKAR